jgi:hypothetical protein
MQIGSIVRVVTTGSRYGGYDKFFEYYGLDEYIDRYRSTRDVPGICEPGDMAEVLEIHDHLRDGFPLYVMRVLRNDAIVLFNSRTLEEVSSPCNLILDTNLGDMPLSALFDQ